MVNTLKIVSSVIAFPEANQECDSTGKLAKVVYMYSKENGISCLGNIIAKHYGLLG